MNILKPKLLLGKIYFTDEISLEKPKNFIEDFDRVIYNHEWNLQRCVILQNGENERIKFDIIPDDKDYYESYFTGFLYNDGKIIGNVKYEARHKTPDCKINGFYEKTKSNKILMNGIWQNPDGIKEGFWIELTEDLS